MTKPTPHSERSWIRPRGRAFWLILLGVLAIFLARPLALGGMRLVYPFPYRDLIEQEASRHDLDPLLVVSVMRVESGFAPEARSGVGARGLMQLMPATAAWVARKADVADFDPDRLEDPETNIRLGCWYLGYLKRQFPGELSLILAAYNGGEGNVAKWRRTPDALEAAFPETRQYVRRGLQTYRMYRLLYREAPADFHTRR